MDRDDFIKEILDIEQETKYEEKFSIEIELTNGDYFTISSGNCFVGGDREGFMSSELGNIQYSDICEIAEDIYNRIEDNNYKIKEITYSI